MVAASNENQSVPSGTPLSSSSGSSFGESPPPRCKPTPRKLYEPGDTPTKKVAKAAKASKKKASKKKASKKKRKNGPANGGAQPRKKAKRVNIFMPKEDELIVKAYSATSQNGVKGSDQKVDNFKRDV
jgi:hypothetical protein